MKFKIYPTVKICREFKHGKVGDINDFCFVGCNLVMKERCHVATHCSFVGRGTVYMDDDSTLAPGCVLYTSAPDVKEERNGQYDTKTKIKTGDIHIGKNVFIGTGVTIGYGTTIDNDVIIGAGTFVGANKVIFCKRKGGRRLVYGVDYNE